MVFPILFSFVRCNDRIYWVCVCAYLHYYLFLSLFLFLRLLVRWAQTSSSIYLLLFQLRHILHTFDCTLFLFLHPFLPLLSPPTPGYPACVQRVADDDDGTNPIATRYRGGGGGGRRGGSRRWDVGKCPPSATSSFPATPTTNRGRGRGNVRWGGGRGGA